MKFRVECGSLVTVLRKKTYVIHANSEEEAAQKADDKFRKDCQNANRYIDVGDTVNIDKITKEA